MKKVYVVLAFIAGLIMSEGTFMIVIGTFACRAYLDGNLELVLMNIALLYFFKQIYTDRKLDRISEELKTLNRTVKMSVIKNGASKLLAEELGKVVKSTDKNTKGK